MNRIFLSAVCLTGSLIAGPSLAQSLPACIHAASDYDGDGWGWEASFTGNYTVPTFSSCVVDSTSLQAPTYTNLETNETVDLIRPYWNAYRDFEGRTIQCDFYVSGSDGYQPRFNYFYSNGFANWADNGISTEHFPLQAEFPWTGYARNFAYNGNETGRVNYKQSTTYWTVNDGIYYSNAGNKQDGREHVLASARYVELIDDHNGAVRYWNHQDVYGANGYAECFDVGGNRFQPSGYPEEARPAAQAVETPLIATAASPYSSADIINLETGQPVTLKEVRWNLTNLYTKTMSCSSVYWTDDSVFSPHAVNNGLGYSTAISGSTAYYSPYRWVTFYSPDYKTTATAQSSSGLYSTYEFFSGNGTEGNWSILNSEITQGPLSDYKYVEEVSDSETRFWKSSEEYDVCNEIPAGAYEHVDAADLTCIDTDGDGWGWDGVDSCEVEKTTPNTCIDSDGDGWGWDGENSCRIEPTTPDSNTCIDSDGDGWGWDGENSCRIEPTAPDSNTCIDSDGDGWGWDGENSCRV